MAIFTDKNTKSLFILITSILLLFLIAGQLLLFVITNEYKQSRFSHDYALAGYLEQEGVNTELIQRAFSSEKTAENLSTGTSLLQAAGYSSNLSETFILDVQEFHIKYSIYLLILTIVMIISIVAVILYDRLTLDRKLLAATTDINEFLNGNTDIRLKQLEEGSLSRLFNSINNLTTSLNSHIVKEKQYKEFLKDTISNISHQLKTPLAALRMYNEILQEEKTENDVVIDFLNKTDRELNRMEILIMNLLKLARFDANSIELNTKRCQLKYYLEELIETFRTRATNENKQLIVICDEEISLDLDEEWMYESLSNLIKNSLDHTKAQDVVTITCQETQVVKEIIIKDNGSGIHPEDIHNIFKRFYRSRYSKDTRGIGIGLTIAKTIIEKHGGAIAVESELGKGTSFIISFPKLTNM